MHPSETAPQNSVTGEISTQTTRRPASFLQRAVWTVCLMVIGSALAIHGALAYSPELARYVPDVLIKQPSACQNACPSQAFMSSGCQARTVNSADFGGCCSLRGMDRPLLTDGLYHEDETANDARAELPADALDCLPEAEETPETANPQA